MSSADSGVPSDRIDTTRPHPARMWNYWTGGEHHHAIDREVGDQIIEAFPGTLQVARQSRACLGRMVRHLVAEEGVRQFLDVGSGLPAPGATHEVARRIAPECRVVYADNDPMVLALSRTLLDGRPEGRTSYVDGDVRDPARILRAAAGLLDFTEPVGLILFGLMGNVIDDEEASAIVRHLVGALPSGSFLALNDGSGLLDAQGRAEAVRIAVERGSTPYVSRTPEEITRFFDGLDLLEPGVVSTSLWRPDPSASPAEVDAVCGLARKP